LTASCVLPQEAGPRPPKDGLWQPDRAGLPGIIPTADARLKKSCYELVLIPCAGGSVALRHPHIRLAVYDRLLSSRDCINAISETARQCGLRCPPDLCAVRLQVERGACGSLTTAKVILEATAPADAARLASELESLVEQYKIAMAKPHCRGVDGEPTVIDCGGMAPIVMDFLLQLLEVYWTDPARA